MIKEALIDYYKNLTFNYGDFDGMSNAEDVVNILEKGELSRLGLVSTCPPDEFRPRDGLCESNTSHLTTERQTQQCNECWGMLFEE